MRRFNSQICKHAVFVLGSVLIVLTTQGAAAEGTTSAAASTPTQCLAAVVGTDPLTFHLSLVNADDAKTIYVPRIENTLGVFVTVEVMDAKERTVYEATMAKFNPKRAPKNKESYIALEPGQSHGALFVLEGFTRPRRGKLKLKIHYTNRQYQGFEGHSVGELSHALVLTVP